MAILNQEFSGNHYIRWDYTCNMTTWYNKTIVYLATYVAMNFKLQRWEGTCVFANNSNSSV